MVHRAENLLYILEDFFVHLYIFLPLKVRESYKIVHYPAIFSAYKSRGIFLRLPPTEIFTVYIRRFFAHLPDFSA